MCPIKRVGVGVPKGVPKDRGGGYGRIFSAKFKSDTTWTYIFGQLFESHSREPPSSAVPPLRETTALPSFQNSTRSRPAGHANALFSGPPGGGGGGSDDDKGEEGGGMSPRIASSKGQSRRSRLSIASPNLITCGRTLRQRTRGKTRENLQVTSWAPGHFFSVFVSEASDL